MQIRSIILTTAIILQTAIPAIAEITTTGDIDPTIPPSTWTTDTDAYVGKNADGTLVINNGSQTASRKLYIGFDEGATGTVTVDGAGSSWNEYSTFYIGSSGSGTLNMTAGGEVKSAEVYMGENEGSLGVVTVDGTDSIWNVYYNIIAGKHGTGVINISNGGQVSAGYGVFLGYQYYYGYNPNASGQINFNNGTLTAETLYAGIDGLSGTGTINTRGLVSDVDLVFDSTHGTTQTFNVTEPGVRDLTFNLNVDGTSTMGAGHSGSGSMHIADGVNVSSQYGYIGFLPGSSGVVTVDGPGSTWNNDRGFYIGHLGNGELNITNGGKVHTARTSSYDNDTYIGHKDGSSGIVNVDGKDSEWNIGNRLYIGTKGNSQLNITGGGKVFNYRTSHIGGNGKVKVDGEGSEWMVGSELKVTGEMFVSNAGKVISSYADISNSTSEAKGVVTVDGTGSQWNIQNGLRIGDGKLEISNGGQVSCRYGQIGDEIGLISLKGKDSMLACEILDVGYRDTGKIFIEDNSLVIAEKLKIDLYRIDDSSINMSTGGMVALFGDADDSLVEFLDLIEGTDNINFWDDLTSGWTNIAGGTMGVDFTLDYKIDGDLAGYTVLTVPEPATILVLGLGGIALITKRRRAKS